MKDWIPQIMIGIIVTVVGTLIANAIIRETGGGKRHFGGGHFHGPWHSGR